MTNAIKKSPLTHWIITLCLTVLGLGLFLMSFTTNYYTYGGLNSPLITALIACALVCVCADMILSRAFPDAIWTKYLTFLGTGLLAASAVLIIGDRVEAIGTTIMTDYDSGHGGEEAIYYSLGGAVCLLIAMVYNIIGVSGEKAARGKRITAIAVASVLAVAVLLVTLNLTGVLKLGGRNGGSGGSVSADAQKTYVITFNQGNNNVDADTMPDYQFLPSNLGGLCRADARMNVEVKLTLDGAGKYSLFAESYVIESGKKAVVGDDTGLGLVLTDTAEGAYTTEADGRVTIAAPDHAVVVVETDTYSAQMKSFLKVGDHDEDGTYDSAEYPEVLDYVPDTVFTLAEGTIVTYAKADPKGDYTISFTQSNNNVDADVMPDYQFLPSNLGGLCRADARMYVDVKLSLDGAGNYVLFSEAYVIESGKKAVVGDDTGLGLVLTDTAEGTYTLDDEGRVTISVPTHNVVVVETDTYSAQMKSFLKVGDHDEDGTYDSAEYPEVLDYVPETVFTLSGRKIETYEKVEQEEEPEPEPTAAPAPEASAEAVVIASDDGATQMTFAPDGTYTFAFPSYSIEDKGTYTYENGVLTLTDVNGKETKAEGDPIKLHYAYSGSDQLTGEFTIPASSFEAPTAESAPAAEPVVIASDDGATEMTFNPDGTYRFWFASYSIEDKGTYTYENGVLTLTDVNGKETRAEGDPIKLHYAYSGSDQLTGEFTVPAELLNR